MDPVVAVRALHIVAAALWAGSVFLMAFVIGPTMRSAGPAAGTFMMAILRRGGLTPYLLGLGTVTVLAGGYLYQEFGYASHPFSDGPSTMVTLGALFALVALLVGYIVLLPNEMKMKKLAKSLPPGPPPAAAAASLQAMGAKQGKFSTIGGALITLALLCMALRPLLA